MELFRDTNIDFMKYRKVWVWVSVVFVLLGIAMLFSHEHLNLGIDFAGGTQITLKFQEDPDIDRLRNVLEGSGLGDAQIQRFGEAGSHEVIVKTPVVDGSDEGSLPQVVDALKTTYGGSEGSAPDLNRIGSSELARLLQTADPEGLAASGTDPVSDAGLAHYEGIAEAVLEVRRDKGLITSWADLENAEGVSSEVLSALEQQTQLSDFAVLSVENVGPQIGRELSRRGILAIALSLVGMLAYIWIRFELRFGVGAVVALFHDTLVCLGLFALFDFEFNLTTIAAFLTLVGYSVNDTVVVFDRVRENLRKNRRQPLVHVLNHSLNQTLSRTVLTSGTTLLAVGTLLTVGGDVLRGFAFVLTVGIIVGTYSSIYVASPIALIWDQLFTSKSRGGKRAKAA